MKNLISSNPTKSFATITLIATVLNILLTLLIGFVFFYSIGVGDPTTTVDIEAFVMQKHLELKIVKVLTVFFVIGFIMSLVFWLKEKLYWNFILSALALTHFLILIYIFYITWMPALFYSASALDLVIIVVVFIDTRFRHSSIKT